EGRNPGITGFPQIAFGIAPMVEGCYRIYRASKLMGEAPSVYLKYAKYAGLFASYFTGNTIYGVPVYDPNTGICFDGLEAPENPVDTRINRNSGGESTVETLNALLLVLTDTNCKPYVYSREQKKQSQLILEAESADEINSGAVNSGEWFGDFVSGQMFSGSKYVQLSAGGSIKKIFYTENPYSDLSDNYLVYLCYAKRTSANADTITVTVDDVAVNFYTGGSPDSDYLFFEKMTNSGQPRVFSLPPGPHTLRITAGSKPLILDQIVIQPVVQRKTFLLSDGSAISVDRPFLSQTGSASVPSGLVITPVRYGNTLQINWDRKPSVYGYNLYRKSDTETSYSLINTRPLTKENFIDNGLVAGTRYGYRLSSISNYLWQESGLSQEVFSTPLSPQTAEMELTETENDWSVSKSGVYFSSSIFNGFAETKAYEVDIDRYPDISLSINNPSDTYWSFSVLRWIPEGASFFTFEEVPLQDKTRDTGLFNYDLKSLLGWTGHQALKLRFYLSRNNLTTFMNEIKINNKDTEAVYSTITSPQLWFSSDGISPAYYIPDVNLSVDAVNKKVVYSGSVSLDNLELMLYKEISADFSCYRSIMFDVSTGNEWALVLELEGEQITLSPFANKSGSFFFNLADSSEGKCTGLQNAVIKFKVRTSGAVQFEVSGLKLSTSPVPFFSSYNGVRSLPNPFTPGSGDSRFNQVIFYFNQDAGKTGTIRIFSVDGKKIREITGAVSGQSVWNGKDADGNPAGSGVYIFQITTEGKKVQTGSMVIIR
ncbi:MAG: T9SS type A sorting domain-containing protein, partial [bacterium]|nr:T9SS type A sorting domain-containing protein [bacterium]